MKKVVINSDFGGFGLSEQAEEWLKERGVEDPDDLERDDPLLVECVGTLGEEANGRFSELKIVEIPDDVDYLIEDYDGREHVAEKHRTWS